LRIVVANIGDASSGAKTPQAAMDRSPPRRTFVMERLEKGRRAGRLRAEAEQEGKSPNTGSPSRKDGNIARQRKLAQRKAEGRDGPTTTR